MQPDSNRPAASIPNFAFNDDMSSSNRQFSAGALSRCAANAKTDWAALSSKPFTILQLGDLFSDVQQAAVSFLPLKLRHSVLNGLQIGYSCRIDATDVPLRRQKVSWLVNSAVIHRLPESG
jgi:hypothetical protein